MISTFKPAAAPIITVTLLILTIQSVRVFGEEPNGQTSDRLPLSIASVTGTTVPRLQKSVQWKDGEYDVHSGIDVVMSVVRDPQAGVKERELALIQLAMLRTQLKGRPCLDELGTIYDDARGLEKQLAGQIGVRRDLFQSK